MTEPKVLDAREIPLLKKLGIVVAAVEALESGESIILVNDIDPKPLRLRLGNGFQWEALSSTKGEHRIRITRL
jgi:uncharacterized protein (DUF2249 family)